MVTLGVGSSVITSVVVASRAYEARGKQQAGRTREITVKGSARQRVTSDLALWTITVWGEAQTLEGAFAKIESGGTRVGEFLKAKGFAEGEMTLSPIGTSTYYKRDEHGNELRDVASYKLWRQYSVRTGNVTRVATAAGEVTQLLKDGVQVGSEEPEFYFQGVAGMKVQLVGKATQDARNRAEEIAKNAGCTLDDVRQAQMGVVQITQPDSMDVSSSGVYDTDTIEKDVSVVVTLTVGIHER